MNWSNAKKAYDNSIGNTSTTKQSIASKPVTFTTDIVDDDGMFLPFKGYTLDDDAKRSFDLIKSGAPVTFITGSGGVGKSSLLKYIRANMNRNIVVTAPTGVAALNAQGITVNSFFWFPPHMLQESDVRFRNDEVIKSLEILIIDEVSMIRADMMDMIDYCLRKWRTNNKPFGGVQLVLFGDLFQLCPIVKRGEEKNIIEDRYPHGHYFFNANVFDRIRMATIELKHVYRQSDAKFIGMLDRIRKGYEVHETVKEFNRLCHRKAGKHSIILTSTNDAKDMVNNRAYDKLDADEVVYKANVNGDVKNTDDRYPSPEVLALKNGCRVMVTKNIPDIGVVNGALGVVLDLYENHVRVLLDDSRIVKIMIEEWLTYKFECIVTDDGEKKIITTITGSYTQIPLTLAYAISIHKSQSMSFDDVCIDLGRNSFAYGMTYVALSRCRNLTSLVLSRPLSVSDIKVDDAITKFYAKALASEKAMKFRVDDSEMSTTSKYTGTKIRAKKLQVKESDIWCTHITKNCVTGWDFCGISAEAFKVCPICGTKNPI